MKKLICISIVIISLISWFLLSTNKDLQSVETPPGVILTIEASKNSFLQAENVWVQVKLINKSGFDYELKSDFFFLTGISFHILDPDGNKIQNNLIAEQFGENNEKLLSGDTVIKIGNLSWYFNKYQNYEGNFTIQAEYQKIKSNVIDIQITPPSGNDEIVYERMRSADNKLNKSEITFANLLTDMENLLYEYPSSIYAPLLYNRITLSTPIFTEEERFNNLKDFFFSRYQNSYENYLALENYKMFLKKIKKLSDAEVQAELEELSNRNQGTFLNKLISEGFIKND